MRNTVTLANILVEIEMTGLMSHLQTVSRLTLVPKTTLKYLEMVSGAFLENSGHCVTSPYKTSYATVKSVPINFIHSKNGVFGTAHTFYL
jgi:hypothetical protein